MNKLLVALLISAGCVSAFASDNGYSVESTSARAKANSYNTNVADSRSGNININEAAEIPTDTRNTVNYQGTYTIKNVPSMAAPGLTTTLTETCMGSTSGSIAVAGFGASLGTTWRDDECVNRLNARELKSLGYTEVACEVLRVNTVVAKAFETAGQTCKVAVAAPVIQQVVTPAPVEAAPVVTKKRGTE